MTTFRKLPITRANANAAAINIADSCVKSSATYLNNGTHLEYRQVHGDDEATDENTENSHD